MRIGFTGTRKGMDLRQMKSFVDFLSLNIQEFHHGMCVGSDTQAHQFVRLMLPDCKIVGHPPKDRRYVGVMNNQVDKIWDPKEYLERNKDIVNCSDLLVATPFGLFEDLRSGTWATVRYARKVNILEKILWEGRREK